MNFSSSQKDMRSVRTKVWVTEDQVAVINRFVMSRIETDTSPELKAIHDEVAVATQRFQASTPLPSALSHALGRADGDVPLSLSVDEISYLLARLKPMPDALMTVLMEAV